MSGARDHVDGSQRICSFILHVCMCMHVCVHECVCACVCVCVHECVH